jgi:hypothetical protein
LTLDEKYERIGLDPENKAERCKLTPPITCTSSSYRARINSYGKISVPYQLRRKMTNALAIIHTAVINSKNVTFDYDGAEYTVDLQASGHDVNGETLLGEIAVYGYRSFDITKIANFTINN